MEIKGFYDSGYALFGGNLSHTGKNDDLWWKTVILMDEH